MEVKIKNNNELVDATIEMVDGVMVVSPKEVKFEPKDGDVVSYLNNNKPTIYVYKDGKYNTSFYVAYSSIRKQCFLDKGAHLDMDRSDIRPASEEEKQILFDKLKAECWEWDAEKKELVKIKWKPTFKETYYRPDFDHCQFICYSGTYDYHKMIYIKDHINKGWVFRTKEECQEFCDRLNNALNQVKP